MPARRPPESRQPASRSAGPAASAARAEELRVAAALARGEPPWPSGAAAAAQRAPAGGSPRPAAPRTGPPPVNRPGPTGRSPASRAGGPGWRRVLSGVQSLALLVLGVGIGVIVDDVGRAPANSTPPAACVRGLDQGDAALAAVGPANQQARAALTDVSSRNYAAAERELTSLNRLLDQRLDPLIAPYRAAAAACH